MFDPDRGQANYHSGAAFVPSVAGQAPFLVKNGAKSYLCGEH